MAKQRIAAGVLILAMGLFLIVSWFMIDEPIAAYAGVPVSMLGVAFLVWGIVTWARSEPASAASFEGARARLASDHASGGLPTSGSTTDRVSADEPIPEGGWPYQAVARPDKWSEFGADLCRQGLMGTVAEPRLYILWKTSEMAERVAKYRPAATQAFLVETPEVMTFADGSGAVGCHLARERDLLQFTRVLLEGKDYGAQAVFQGVLATNLPESDGGTLASLFGAPEGVAIGNVFMLG
jgi:hypothetical protein